MSVKFSSTKIFPSCPQIKNLEGSGKGALPNWYQLPTKLMHTSMQCIVFSKPLLTSRFHFTSFICISAGSLKANITPKSTSHFTTLTWNWARLVYHMITLKCQTCVTSLRNGLRTLDRETTSMDTAAIWRLLLSNRAAKTFEWSSGLMIP